MTNKKELEVVEKNTSSEKEIVSKQKLLEAGVYFGHKAAQWNPKMKPYIHTKKMGTHIIDILKTQKALEFAYKLVYKFAQKGATFIFVGTKKQAKKAVQEQAIRTNSVYVSERWLGGTLTNNRTIFSRVREMMDLEKQSEEGFAGYTKKEGVLKAKELDKLHKNLNGIRNMKQLPQVMIIADPKNDINAVKEARKKGIKVIGLLDTDVDPTLVDFGIPANDDSTKSITLILTILADAIVAAKNGKQLFAYQDDASIVLPEEPGRERKENNQFSRPRREFSNERNSSSEEEKTNDEKPRRGRPRKAESAE